MSIDKATNIVIDLLEELEVDDLKIKLRGETVSLLDPPPRLNKDKPSDDIADIHIEIEKWSIISSMLETRRDEAKADAERLHAFLYISIRDKLEKPTEKLIQAHIDKDEDFYKIKSEERKYNLMFKIAKAKIRVEEKRFDAGSNLAADKRKEQKLYTT